MARRSSRGGAPRSSRDRARDGDVDPRELAAARRRIKAAKMCSASLYAVAAMVPAFCALQLIGSAIVGVGCIILGIIGLVGLSNAGPPPFDADSQGGVVRQSARMYSGAKVKAWIAIAIGAISIVLLLLGILGLALLLSQQDV